MVTVSLVVELDTRYTRVERTRCANHMSLHTRVQLRHSFARRLQQACMIREVWGHAHDSRGLSWGLCHLRSLHFKSGARCAELGIHKAARSSRMPI